MKVVTVLCFARAREIVEASELRVELTDGGTSADLVAWLVQHHPKLQELFKSCVLAVNQEYVQLGDAVPLSAGDEVAIIPPLSGG
jgi:molybdopterin converting factor subunit 1